MRPTFKKLEVKDLGDLEKLVAENVEGIEAGLKVIDTRLVLGQAAIDLVSLDSQGLLVLIALDFTADEVLLLRAMDAYSWCLEYPDAIRRLYPMARISTDRPPRILFVVERLTDAFLRRIKQLSFLEIDCIEFRHLEVNGTSALYFDLVQRLRKSAVAEAAAAEPPASPVVAASVPAPVAPPPPPAPPVAPPRVVEPEPPASPVVAAPVLAEESRAIVEEPAAPAPSLQRQLAEILAAVGSEVPESAEAVAEPAPEPAPVLQTESAQDAGRQSVVEQAAANPEWQALLSSLGAQIPAPPDPAAPAAEPATVEEPVAAMPDEETAEAPVQREEPRAAPVPTPAWAKPAEKVVSPASGGRTYFFAQASKAPAPSEAAPAAAPKVEAPTVRAAVPVVAPAPAPAAAPAQPVPAPKAAAPAAAPVPPAPAAPAPDRPELHGLDLPKDGLSRQWLEFLNQLGAAK
ncbi:MAG: hypothetical protein HYS77_12340 [Candidatus Rokubacteria bacterium]|nr:hypothetical protein [Candidatus Rokubacteria bacterium]